MDLFLDSPGGGGGPAGSSAANVACRRARKPGEKVLAARQQPSVCPRRVSGASPASVVVAGKALPHRGQGVVRELTRWKACTLIAAVGRYVRMAFANAADGSVATTSILSPEAGVRAASQTPTPVFLRPTSTPRTRPVSRSPIVEIHGSCRRHLPVGNRK